MNSQIGALGQVFYNGRDLTRFARSFRVATPLGTVDITKLRPPGMFREFDATILSGTAGFAGDLPSDATLALSELNDALKTRTARPVLLAPFGADVGNLAIAGQSLRTSLPNDTSIEGLISYAQDWQLTSGAGFAALAPGVCLFTPNGVGSSAGGSILTSEVKTVNASGTVSAGSLTLPATSLGAGGTLSVTTTETNTSFKSKLSGLAGYNTSGVTVTGAVAVVAPDNRATSTSSASSNPSSPACLGPGNAADGNSSSYWYAQGTPVDWIYDLGNGFSEIIKAYAFTVDSTGPTAWIVYGSNDGVSWTGITNRAGQTVPAGRTEYEMGLNAAVYRYLKFSFSAFSGSPVSFYAIELLNGVTGGTGTLTATLAGALAGVNVGNWSITGAGWSTATTTEGSTQTYAGSEGRNLVTAPVAAAGVRDQDGISSTPTASTVLGATAILNVSEIAGSSPTVSVVIEHALDASGSPGTWATLVTFDAATGVSAQLKKVADGVTIRPWVRARVTSVTGTAVLTVAFARGS